MTTDYFSGKTADNFRFAKSRSFITVDADTYNAIRVPRNAFVTDVWLHVTTACSTGLTVGWSGNGETAVTDGFLTSDIANATVTGMKRAQHDTETSFQGKYFNAGSGLITVTVGTTHTAGIFTVFAEYTVIM